MIGAGLIAFASKDMIKKLLGPTFDYLGEEIKNLVEKRCKNIGAIFSKATYKIGTNIEEPGEVSPRVLKQIIDEGSFCEDNLTQEYYAGLLAFSRKGINENNEDSIPFFKLVERMSSNQISLHYFIYYTLIKNLVNLKINVFQSQELQNLKIGFSIISILEIFGEENLSSKLSDECTLAMKESLLSSYNFGIDKDIFSHPTESEITLIGNTPFLSISPSLYGLNLFLKANNAPSNILENKESKEKWCNDLNPIKTLSIMPILINNEK